MGLTNQDLWFRIDSFDLESGNPGKPFLNRLVRELQWTPDFAEHAIGEYKRFCYLVCVSDTEQTPSKIIDLVWHQHLQFTRNYWDEFCEGTLFRKLHHHPGNGSEEDNERFRTAYAGTLLRYQEEFDTSPLQEYWMQTPEVNGGEQIQMASSKAPPSKKLFEKDWAWLVFFASMLFTAIIAYGPGWEHGGDFFKFVGASFMTVAIPFLVVSVFNGNSAKAGAGNSGCGGGCGSTCCGGCGGH